MGIIDNLESLLQNGQDNTLLRFGLGTEYLKQDNPAKAIEHLQQAVTLEPEYSAAWKLLGKALATLDDKQGAIQAYEKGIAAAEKKGDKQAAKEMGVFLKRLLKK